MSSRLFMIGLLLSMGMVVAAGPKPGNVKGTFVVGGVNAKLANVRAVKQPLDGAKDKLGYSVLLSERPSKGDVREWRSAEPSKSGSFIFVQFEPNGSIWIADIGHASAKSGRFGVVTEVKTASFKIDGGRLAAHITTNGDQVFTDDHYAIDLTLETPIENP